jgi:hypothetical protein
MEGVVTPEAMATIATTEKEAIKEEGEIRDGGIREDRERIDMAMEMGGGIAEMVVHTVEMAIAVMGTEVSSK